MTPPPPGTPAAARVRWAAAGIGAVLLWLAIPAWRTAFADPGAVRDFHALRSFGTALRAGVDLYDADALRRFQQEMLGTRAFFPFAYPPHSASLWSLLAALPAGLGWALWSLAGLGGAARVLGGAGRRWLATATVLLLMPAVVLCLSYGQTGLIVAALIGGTALALPRRPGWGGVMAGLLTIKPQFALPLWWWLLVRRERKAGRALMIAAGTALVLALTSWAITAGRWGGPASWHEWLAVLPLQLARNSADPRLTEAMVSVRAALVTLGLSGEAARIGQGLAALAALALLWRHRDADPVRLAPLLLAAPLLVTPYAFGYDLPLVTLALLMMLATRWREARRIDPAVFSLLVMGTAALYAPTGTAGPVLLAGWTALVVALAARQASMRPSRSPVATAATPATSDTTA